MKYLKRFYILAWKWESSIDGYKAFRVCESNDREYIFSVFKTLTTSKDVPKVELIDAEEETNDGQIAYLEYYQGKTVRG